MTKLDLPAQPRERRFYRRLYLILLFYLAITFACGLRICSAQEWVEPFAQATCAAHTEFIRALNQDATDSECETADHQLAQTILALIRGNEGNITNALKGKSKEETP